MYDRIRVDALYIMFYGAVTAVAAIASCYLLLRRANAIAPAYDLSGRRVDAYSQFHLRATPDNELSGGAYSWGSVPESPQKNSGKVITLGKKGIIFL